LDSCLVVLLDQRLDWYWVEWWARHWELCLGKRSGQHLDWYLVVRSGQHWGWYLDQHLERQWVPRWEVH
jgi:hypothetical protein